MSEASVDRTGNERATAFVRLAVGLAQGLALYLLYSAYDAHSWPATQGAVFAPLILVWLFVPLLFNQALGNIRLRTLLLWMLAAAAILAGLGWYDIWRDWPWDTLWTNGGQQIVPH